MKAILLHHAGGDKYAYRNMQKNLLPEIESISVELPGRGDRFKEKFVTTLQNAVEDIYQQIEQNLNEEYCIIGNSMGSIIAFLLTHKIKKENQLLPKHLFLSARLSPDAYKNEPNWIGCPSEEFWKIVQQYDGVPAALLAHQELLNFYEPILRSDFELLHHFNESFVSCEPIEVATTVLFGNEDTRNVDREKMQGWSKFFINEIYIEAFDGKHFFLYENEAVVNYIKNILKN